MIIYFKFGVKIAAAFTYEALREYTKIKPVFHRERLETVIFQLSLISSLLKTLLLKRSLFKQRWSHQMLFLI